MNSTHRFLLAALVSSSLGVVAMPALAQPGDQNGEQQVAEFDGDRDHGQFMGGPHGPGRGGPQGMAHFQGGPGGGRHGGPMGGPGFGGPMGGPGGPVAEMVIERFDVNGDGQITKDEVTTVTAEKVKTFDANADGSLSLEEYKALWTDAMNERHRAELPVPRSRRQRAGDARGILGARRQDVLPLRPERRRHHRGR